MSRPHFPFSAVVGMDDLGLALCLAAVSPQIGGVLARGEKGTAKSTMVRALTSALPPVTVVAGCRFACDPAAPEPDCPDGPHVSPEAVDRPARLVELPVGAAEERLTGSLHLDRLLTSHQVAYDPGLLAQAHRGVLYVDEVNLLPDHLVDLLLDAAAMGRAAVEREGASLTHAAQFLLVGTMNPEEGELRPQLLDRFGLAVDVAASRDPEVRVDVMQRRLAYESDPEAFAAAHSATEEQLAERIATARAALPHVVLSRREMLSIARVCTRVEVDGMRADLVMARTAVAHAAWNGRTDVIDDDVRVAARLALPHRQRRNPFDDSGSTDGLEELLDDVLPPATGPGDDPDDVPPDGSGPDGPGGGAPEPDAALAPDCAPDPPADSGPGMPPRESDARDEQAARTTAEAAGPAYRPRLLTAPHRGPGAAGRRSTADTTSGRQVRDVPVRDPRGTGLAATATVMRSVRRAATGDGQPGLRADDVRRSLRRGREGNLVVFAVDTSGSMGAAARVRELKTACLSLLLDAYQRRDKVAVVTFARHRAHVVLPPTSSVGRADRELAQVATGGRTPLAEGLAAAGELILRERRRDPLRRPLLVVLTDGRGTHGVGALPRAHRAAGVLGTLGVASVVIDCEEGRGIRLGLARTLAGHLQADYLVLSELAVSGLSGAVHERKVA
jgi:magnesium chelatase subunit D